MLLFKYVNPTGLRHVLRDETRLSLLFGLPRQYNDPYELFLQTDRPLDSDEERAFYEFWLAEILQAPVTCFSLIPDSVVMWAHYGREATGACIAYDEDALAQQFEVAFFENVTYSAEPAQIDAYIIKHAFTTAKRRHTLAAIEAGSKAAYFVKRIEWQYERERRMVVDTSEVRPTPKGFLADIAPECVRYVVVGAKATRATVDLCAARAKCWNVPLLRMRIGKRSYRPFFTTDDATFVWTGDRFATSESVCSKCLEPCTIIRADGLCDSCGIDDEVRREASLRSMLGLTLHLGLDKGIHLSFGFRPKGRWQAREAADTTSPQGEPE